MNTKSMLFIDNRKAKVIKNDIIPIIPSGKREIIEQEEEDIDEKVLEIPAFLRRQAN